MRGGQSEEGGGGVGAEEKGRRDNCSAPPVVDRKPACAASYLP